MPEKDFKEQVPVKKGFTEQVHKGGVTVNKNPGPDAAGSRKTEKPKTPVKNETGTGGAK